MRLGNTENSSKTATIEHENTAVTFIVPEVLLRGHNIIQEKIIFNTGFCIVLLKPLARISA